MNWIRIFVVGVLAIGGARSWAVSPLKPVVLTCENIVNPINVETKDPRFSWQFTSDEKDQMQSAYEIIVSNKTGSGESPGNIVWKSGKILSDQNTNISYSGAPLKAFTRYYWTVHVYDQNGGRSMSDVAWFETSMLDQSDWSAKWIGDGSKLPANDEDYFKEDRMPLFRRMFSSMKSVA